MTQEHPFAEQLRRLRDALDTMEPLPRAVFDLHRYRDLDFSQIADELGISVAEVERQFAAAMLHLLLSTHEDGGP
ncbi:RNA polymerase sigma factor [Sphingomonas azotifigens]|uniref:RNA polymerase sigma factor n=1 Tax=Sphingomonas azotifigens TaxID=330920 RepID=UPI000A056A5B|nr:sigma factor-like helix-turn-helix DNA-binding protein [Sphingomonas azotifigens]